LVSKNKILEAMSMRLPCVTTSLVNNAIGATPGLHILVADTLEGIVSHIEFLMDHPEEYDKIATAGRDFVVSHFSWEDQVYKMEEFIFSKKTYSHQ
jgi:glycosyltransferase involved in cell wall biosynthesis